MDVKTNVCKEADCIWWSNYSLKKGSSLINKPIYGDFSTLELGRQWYARTKHENNAELLLTDTGSLLEHLLEFEQKIHMRIFATKVSTILSNLVKLIKKSWESLNIK